MNKLKRIMSAIIALASILLIACNNDKTNKNSAIRVGSKDFTENLIISEIYALALENAGYDVERKQNIAGSIVHTSIINDEIDLYPEYTGTALISILKMDMLTDPQVVYDTVKKEYNEKFNLTWLDYSLANDGQGLVIRTDIANSLAIKNISDLQLNASKLRFASQGEFDLREDGLICLENVYGDFNWKSSTVYDNGLKYTVLLNDEADVTPAYTTEGQLADSDNFTLLIDDKQAWPPYNLAPIIRSNMLDEYPEIADILNPINKKLNTEIVTKLNAKVDVDKEEYEEVAKEYFESIK